MGQLQLRIADRNRNREWFEGISSGTCQLPVAICHVGMTLRAGTALEAIFASKKVPGFDACP